MIRYTIRTAVCIKCGDALYRGTRRFGPAKVQCGHCQNTVDTGLRAWEALPLPSRLWAAIGEILLPSWLGVSGCNAVVMGGLTHMFFWGCCAMPVILPFMLLSPDSASPTAGFGILAGSLAYPFLLVWRLLRMILESRAYTHSGKIPVWKFGPTTDPSKKNIGGRAVLWRVGLVLVVVIAILLVVKVVLYGP